MRSEKRLKIVIIIIQTKPQSPEQAAHLKMYRKMNEQQRKQQNYVTCNNNACNDHNIHTK